MSYIIDLRKKKFRLLFLFILFIIFFLLGLELVKIFLFPLKYKSLVITYSNLYDLDPYLIFSIIKVESKFNPDAQSHKNAKGLMQITDKTGQWAAKELGIKDYSDEKLYDPEINIQIGCWYINKLLNQFEDVETSLAAYNAGSGNVSKWLKDERYSQDGKKVHEIAFWETKEYVKKVLDSKRIYKKLYKSF